MFVYVCFDTSIKYVSIHGVYWLNTNHSHICVFANEMWNSLISLFFWLLLLLSLLSTFILTCNLFAVCTHILNRRIHLWLIMLLPVYGNEVLLTIYHLVISYNKWRTKECGKLVNCEFYCCIAVLSHACTIPNHTEVLHVIYVAIILSLFIHTHTHTLTRMHK